MSDMKFYWDGELTAFAIITGNKASRDPVPPLGSNVLVRHLQEEVEDGEPVGKTNQLTMGVVVEAGFELTYVGSTSQGEGNGTWYRVVLERRDGSPWRRP